MTNSPKPAPGLRTLTEADVKRIAAQAIATCKRMQAERAVNDKVERVIAATEAVVDEALAMPLHERPEAERRRIESDLWVLAESLVQRRRRSPFWTGVKAA